MGRRKKARSQFRRDLPLVFGFFAVVGILVLAVCAAWNVSGKARERAVRIELLRDANLPAELVSRMRDYDSWNDFLKYTDGYELAWVDAEPEAWVTPEGWEVGEASVGEVLNLCGAGLSPTRRGQFTASYFPEVIREWYYTEDMSAEDYEDRWYLIALYDGEGTVFLYRAHHLYGDADLRVYGDELI